MTLAEIAIVGRGLMGTACARHLAEAGVSVALIGPDEPAGPARHDGPFASHHDAARITRHIATDSDWARLSKRSIDRYRDIEARSGIAFYFPCGGMMAGLSEGPGAAFAEAFLTVAREEAIACRVLSGPEAEAAFPMFRLPPGARAVLDPAGGWIDPRAFRRAEEALAEAAGAVVIRDTVTGRDGGTLALGSGNTVRAGHVVIATGGYAGLDGLLGAPPRLEVFGRTVAFVSLTEAEAEALSGMPTLIWMPEGFDHTLYLLPPVRYPDGIWRIKIGGEGDSPRLTSPAEMTAWFRGGGGAEAGRRLLDALARLMPGLPMHRTETGACAITFTRSGKPIIARLDDATTVLTGGNGAGAKCADELGRLGAIVARGGTPTGEGYGCDFGRVPA